MAAIQNLRAQAKAAGNLKSGSQITVVQQSPNVIVIQPASPQVVYVPVYDPAVVEFRWIYGKYSTTCRTRLTLEHEFRVGAFRFAPYGSVEGFYDTNSHTAEGSYNNPKHIWDQWWYTAGVQRPFKRWFMLQAYYRRENCSNCTPSRWNAGGFTAKFFLNTAK